jgi:hypothetical protein
VMSCILNNKLIVRVVNAKDWRQTQGRAKPDFKEPQERDLVFELMITNSVKSESDAVARRVLQSFLEDINEFAKSGGFRNSTDNERRALNDLMVERYLTEGILKLPTSPIVKKVKEIISDFIHNKCRGLEYCSLTKVKEEEDAKEDDEEGSCSTGANFSVWTCHVCGKCNKKQRVCIVCGRDRNYIGSRKTQQLNKLRIDPTPLTTAAPKDRLLKEAQNSNRCHIRPEWRGEEAKRSILTSTKNDYEEQMRVEIKSEINDVLESLRQTMTSLHTD